MLEDFDIPLVVSLGENCEWEDEFKHSPVKQVLRKTITGLSVFETLFPNNSGQVITLNCGWFDSTVIAELLQIRDRTTQSTMELTLCDGRVFTDVLLAYHLGPPVIITPHLIMPDYSELNAGAEFFDVKLILIDAS